MNLAAIVESPWAVEIRVIQALVLRDTRARFGGGFFGYLVAIGMPFGHLLGLMTIPFLVDRLAPLGTNYALYAATGVLPYILCFYPARMIMACLVDSAPLFGFPIVKPFDVIVGRAILEVAVAFTVTTLFLLVLLIVDIEVLPHDAAQATGAVLSTIYLGVSLGFVSAILYKVMTPWIFIQLTLLILMYLSSGAFFSPWSLPEDVRAVIWFNPLFHSVEWLRFAYYEGYGGELLSRQYLLGFSTTLLLAGMLLERLIRGRLTMV